LISLAVWYLALLYPQPQDLIFIVAIIFASYLAYTKELDKKLFLPLFYPLAPMLFLFALYTNYGIEYLLWLVFIVAGADIGAYFVGKSIGKTSFCATSPNKTLEGVSGGMLVAAIAGTLIAPSSIAVTYAFLISFVVAASSVFGDLFESYLKREANIKDSGDILPGHGGMLDRSDGFLFAGIIMYIALNFLSLV
jgi:phosphatidate cytidylyltransferase